MADIFEQVRERLLEPWAQSTTSSADIALAPGAPGPRLDVAERVDAEADRHSDAQDTIEQAALCLRGALSQAAA